VLRIHITLMPIRIRFLLFTLMRIQIPDPTFHSDADSDSTFHSDAFQFCADPDPDPDPTTHFSPDLDPPMLQHDPLRLTPFTLMRIRILLFTLMRIRIQIQLTKIMRTHADPDPQHSLFYSCSENGSDVCNATRNFSHSKIYF